MDAKTKPKADMDVWTALTHTANFQTQREAHWPTEKLGK